MPIIGPDLGLTGTGCSHPRSPSLTEAREASGRQGGWAATSVTISSALPGPCNHLWGPPPQFLPELCRSSSCLPLLLPLVVSIPDIRPAGYARKSSHCASHSLLPTSLVSGVQCPFRSGHKTLPCLCVLICKMRIIIVATSYGYCKY